MSSTMKGTTIAVAACVIVVAAAARVASAQGVAGTNRSIQAQPTTSSALAAVLTRSCGDCHSNTMVSRWFTKVPPFSTIMAHGAREGRKAVDFSEWTGYTPDQQRAFLISSCATATAGTMPTKAYLKFRGDARLSREDVETICSASRLSGASTAAAATRPAEKVP